MRSEFGDNAARLCGAACRLLGWKPAAFWDATPAELALLLSDAPGEPPDANVIDALKRQFPDG